MRLCGQCYRLDGLDRYEVPHCVHGDPPVRELRPVPDVRRVEHEVALLHLVPHHQLEQSLQPVPRPEVVLGLDVNLKLTVSSDQQQRVTLWSVEIQSVGLTPETDINTDWQTSRGGSSGQQTNLSLHSRL